MWSPSEFFMSKDISILYYNGKCPLIFFRQFFDLLLLFLSQSVKDLNHLLRGLFDGDVSSHIGLIYGGLQIYGIYFNVANIEVLNCEAI